MLVQLTISNFAILEHLEITLKPGLNILSGETGAGKSIIIGAVNLILGGRASSDLIRSGCSEATVEALFSLPGNPHLTEFLENSGIPFDGELLIKRTVSREGRNRISVNGSMATLQMLTRLSGALISISGQHEHQLLLRPDNHIYLLDDFAGLTAEREALANVFYKWKSLQEAIVALKEEIAGISEKQELTHFQIQEIEKAEIRPEEDEVLADEKRRLLYTEELMQIVSEGYHGIYEGNNAVLSFISRYLKRIEKAAEIDPRLEPVRDVLREVEVRLEDVSFSLRDFRNEIDMDPSRLEEVLERLDLLNRLKRKYGPTLNDVLRFRETLSSKLYDMEEKTQTLASLEAEYASVDAELAQRAQALSRKRKKAAKRLEKAVESELRNLHMRETRFLVEFGDDCIAGQADRATQDPGIRADGRDRAEFMISPNVGEMLRPLSKIASGGELSRIMLAVKTILARTASVETIVFDEVDAGISGATAEIVGKKVLSLSKYHQILCITHLPQIVSQGQTHFLVKKEVSGGRTYTGITELDMESRVQEVARLIGGEVITPNALAVAREMLSE